MAILNNLIVNGSARILNKIFCKDLTISNTLSVAGTATFLKATDLAGTANNSPAMIIGGPATGAHIEIDPNEIHAKASGTTVADLWINSNGGKVYLGSGTSLYAENGGFHTADLNSTGTITSVNINNSQKITSYDGYFRNNLRATYFDLQYVAELGGAFYVSPTIIFTNPTNFTIAAASTSGYTYQITIQDASLTTTTISGITWKTNAKIKASGTVDGVVTGTMQGIISSITANSSTHKMIIQLKDGNVSSLTTGNKVGKVTKFSVMVYNIDSKPVGILLNCYGQNDKPTIDLYGGTDTNPNVAIGLLTGRSLPKVGGVDPTGWGIYTSNGFFSGTIYSTSGNIAGWSISTSALYKGTNSTTSTTAGLYLGTDGIRNYKDANNYVTITNGIISAKGANLSGTLSAGAGSTIGPWTISATAIYKISASWGNSSTGAAYFGNDGISITDKFKVSSAGALTALQGSIAGISINSNYGFYTNNKTNGSSTNMGFLLTKNGQIYLGSYNNTYSSCRFQVDQMGILTSHDGHIGCFGYDADSLYSSTLGSGESSPMYFYGKLGKSAEELFGSGNVHKPPYLDNLKIHVGNIRQNDNYYRDGFFLVDQYGTVATSNIYTHRITLGIPNEQKWIINKEHQWYSNQEKSYLAIHSPLYQYRSIPLFFAGTSVNYTSHKSYRTCSVHIHSMDDRQDTQPRTYEILINDSFLYNSGTQISPPINIQFNNYLHDTNEAYNHGILESNIIAKCQFGTIKVGQGYYTRKTDKIYYSSRPEITPGYNGAPVNFVIKSDGYIYWTSSGQSERIKHRITLESFEDQNGQGIFIRGILHCDSISSGSGSTLVVGSDSAGTIYKTSSSIRYKDIKSDLLSSNIESIYNIQPKIAKYKQGILSQTDQANGVYMPMFIAQDVYKYCPEAVIFNQNGEVQDWNFRVLLPVMFQMIKDQKKQIQELKKEVNNK